MDKKCFCLFSTHYHQLQSGLCRLYGNCKAIHMQAQLSPDSSRLKFLHKAAEGTSELADQAYGLAAAGMCGFPEHVLQDASRFRAFLAEKLSSGAAVEEAIEREQADKRVLMMILQRLVIIKDSSMSKDNMREYLQQLRLKYNMTELSTSSS